jgi:hypothetical protein
LYITWMGMIRIVQLEFVSADTVQLYMDIHISMDMGMPCHVMLQGA